MNIRIKGAAAKISNPDDVFAIMQKILLRENKVDRNREHLWTISLNTANKILNIELVSMGSINKTIVEPMEVFSVPLQKRAVNIMLVHNHPSMETTPSAADKDITDRLIQCGLMLHVPVLDHLIITEKKYLSFAQTGLLAELEKSTKYVPDFILKDRIQKQVKAAKKEATREGVDKGKKEGEIIGENKNARAIATAMLQNGEPVDKIMQYTGLSKQAIGQLS